ncbi:MAG TPA: DegV family protein [Dehalococcoidia bacterium]|nr:DegV family protein [Dehalococcoidia bacterium]
MGLRIVTDSTADLDADEAASLGIAVVPLTVFFGDEAFLDRVEIAPEAFYQRLVSSKVFPRTSQPSPARFEETYRKLAEEGADQIVSIHISSRLSGTLNAARVAAGRAPSGCEVVAVDSMSVAGGLGTMARRAAQVAADGGRAEAARRAAEAMIPRHRISILLDTLEYLHKGGRIGRARAMLGGLLNVKPIVRLQDGEVGPGERVRSRIRGIERIYDSVVQLDDLEEVIVQHTGSEAEAEALAARLRAALPNVPVDLRWIGPVVGAYVGPHGIGAVSVQRPAI